MTDIKKRAERNGKVRRTINEIEQTIRKLEAMKAEYMRKAVDAKSRGESASYNLAKSAINTTLAQEKRAKEMLLNIKITAELQKMGETNADFLSGMSTIAKSIAKVNKKSDFVKLQKEIERALSGMEEAQAGLDGFLQNTDSAFSVISSAQGALSDSEIDSLIDGKVTEKQLLMDDEIERLLSGINGVDNNVAKVEMGVRSGGENATHNGNNAAFAPALKFDFGAGKCAPIPKELADKFVKFDVPAVALSNTLINLIDNNISVRGRNNGLIEYVASSNVVNLGGKIKFVFFDLSGSGLSKFDGTVLSACDAVTDRSLVMPTLIAIKEEIGRRRDSAVKMPHIVVVIDGDFGGADEVNALRYIIDNGSTVGVSTIVTDNDRTFESVHCVIALKSGNECEVITDGKATVDRLPDIGADVVDAVISIVAEDRA